MNPSLQEAQTLLASLQQQLAAAHTTEQVEALRVHFLGRKGSLTALMRSIAAMTAEDKRVIAPQLQQIQRVAEEAISVRSAQLVAVKPCASAPCDVTSFIRTTPVGGLHPYTTIIERIETLFMSMGWDIVEGPEVEDEFHNFEALNIPAGHPARDDHDTFWLTFPNRLLRTHTSSVQVRALCARKPPLAICVPGRVFRHEATDATHDAVFTQCEGLLIDKHISLTHLVGTLTLFMQRLFDSTQLSIRLRPSYFPFVRPGLEVDISCPFCASGCSICKYTCWIELGGAGLVHPHVLRSCGIDHAMWSGFAFGFGIERLAMLMYRINDVRLFKTTRISILEQFSRPYGHY